jgi:hypothetical protein
MAWPPTWTYGPWRMEHRRWPSGGWSDPLESCRCACAHRSRPIGIGGFGGHRLTTQCCEDAALPALSRGYVRVAFALE